MLVRSAAAWTTRRTSTPPTTSKVSSSSWAIGQQLTRLEQEFGMTPSARTRIQVPVAPSPVDPYKERYFNKPKLADRT